MWIDRRKNDGRRAQKSVLPGAHSLGLYVLNFARAVIEASDLPAVDDVRIERVRRDVSVLLRAYRIPFAEGDRPVVAAAHGSDRSALLLPAVHPVRNAIVGDHMVELRGRLVVPGAPGLAAIHRERRTLIGRDQHDVRIVGVDPNRW